MDYLYYQEKIIFILTELTNMKKLNWLKESDGCYHLNTINFKFCVWKATYDKNISPYHLEIKNRNIEDDKNILIDNNFGEKVEMLYNCVKQYIKIEKEINEISSILNELENIKKENKI